MERRVLLVNLVTVLLVVGGVLMLMSWTGPNMDPGMALLGLVLAGMHFAAALGTALRRHWGRLLGLVVGWIGVLGMVAVVVPVVAALPAITSQPLYAGGSWLGALLIPGAMLGAYLLIVVVLMRNRSAFDSQLFGQLG